MHWKSLNDDLGMVLKAQYEPQGGGTAVGPAPYTDGPATLPPAAPRTIGSAEQLVFTIGLRENNQLLPRIRSLDISGHKLPRLPDQMGYLPSLTYLNLFNNDIWYASSLRPTHLVFPPASSRLPSVASLLSSTRCHSHSSSPVPLLSSPLSSSAVSPRPSWSSLSSPS